MYTDDNGIVRFESLDNIAPLQVGLNAAMESISGAIDSTIRIWPVANQSEMNDLLSERGASPLEPLYVHRADTGNLERNTGDGWAIYPTPFSEFFRSGTVEIAGAPNDAEVVFDVPFTGSGVPTVVPSYADSFRAPQPFISAFDVTNTGFTLRYFIADNGTHTGTRRFSWIAYKHP